MREGLVTLASAVVRNATPYENPCELAVVPSQLSWVSAQRARAEYRQGSVSGKIRTTRVRRSPMAGPNTPSFSVTTTPTPLQERAFALIESLVV